MPWRGNKTAGNASHEDIRGRDAGRSNIVRHAGMPSPGIVNDQRLSFTKNSSTDDQRLPFTDLISCLLYSYSVHFIMESLKDWEYDAGERIGVHLPYTDTNQLIQISTGPGQKRRRQSGKW